MQTDTKANRRMRGYMKDAVQRKDVRQDETEATLHRMLVIAVTES